MTKVINLTLGIDNDIIKKDLDDLPDQVVKGQLHVPLKCSTYVDQDKRHVFIGKGAPMSGKIGFKFINFLQE